MLDITQNLEDLAYADLKDEKNYVWISEEGMEGMRIMQMGMQYMLSVQRKLRDKISLIDKYKES